ncbi:MAG: polysulfide reductase NrfD, partial [Spirochaetia bacterium]|nr:polysulfide reductase NrfD [Spirochaetia bacterium]
MQTLENPAIRPSLVEGGETYASITETIARPVEAKAPRWWQIGMLGTLSLIAVFLGSIGWLWWDGVGVWGLNNPVFWAFDIINMVFWVGIAHTGTAVTSFLTLSRQNWKNSINRIAEAMTIFSVSCAALFPVIHEGRSWMLHYFMPYPSQMWMWPNFKSPIFADVWALQAYLYVSAVFWYIGMIPDLASLRDRAKNKVAAWAYGVFALGWRSSARHWNHYERAYLIMAGIGTPLVLSVCAIVSMSFAPSVIPGWHATIFPVYFLFGALGAGFACLVLLTVFTRKVFGFEKIITEKHLDLLNKCTL